MTSTFLVEVSTPGDTDLAGIAADIEDFLMQHGLDVKSVHPWARHSSPTLGQPQTPPDAPAN